MEPGLQALMHACVSDGLFSEHIFVFCGRLNTSHDWEYEAVDDLYAAAGCRGGVVQSRARRWAYEHVGVCDGVRRDPWRKALRSTVVGGRGLTTSMSLSRILFITCAGRMLWRGSGNGTRMRVCGTSCCACCVIVCGACCGGGRDVHSDKSLGQGPNLSGS